MVAYRGKFRELSFDDPDQEEVLVHAPSGSIPSKELGDMPLKEIEPSWTVDYPRSFPERLEHKEREQFGTGHFASVYNTFVAGWKAGLVRALALSTGALVINLVVYIWMYRNFGVEHGSGTIVRGSCSYVHRADTGIHGGLNAISTFILGASTYAMEGLMAPSRDEVDRAHAKRKWVEIGVQSLRNLKYISKKRAILWLLLGITSMPLHLFFNSVFFTSSQSNQYAIALVTEGYFTNTTWQPSVENSSPKLFNSYDTKNTYEFWRENDTTVISLLKDGRDPTLASAFVEMDTMSCIRNYSNSFPQSYSDLLVVTSNAEDEPLLWSRYPQRAVSMDKASTNGDPFRWICRDILNSTSQDSDRCSLELAEEGTSHGKNWTLLDHPISRCLARSTPDVCQLQFNVWLMLAVVVVGSIKTIIIAYLVFEKPVGQFLRTLGDAISSFLQFEDETTRGMCLVSSRQIRKDNWAAHYDPQVHTGRHLRWWHGANSVQFFSTIGLSSVYAIVLGIALYFAIDGAHGSAFANGLGVPNIQSLASFQGDDVGSSGIVPSLLVANIPQLGFSILYVAYNNIYCKLAIAEEFDRLAVRRKGLRVSERPRGAQRPTHFFTLPIMYALPLMGVSALLHWMTSQSIFMVRIDGVDRNHNIDPDDRLSRLGYSSAGIIGLVCICLLVTILTLCLGAFKKLHNGLGEVSNSAVISAACHGLPGDNDAHVQEVVWGDVSPDDESTVAPSVRHCSFTSRLAERPIVGQLYR
ncbi:hypothetical protein EJ05DRAFT_502068 [Pseudovirgaria hyperparasitica]|uniref:DUF6536 domain-containing protein n=1 Tax=Pseudovirgaria hyperparasitica TaxID=470096 RepID=A0A6A6W1Y9_9PEZI|nr:uncharacterized protein EJ05DRAFT_502068 [Pseudovirgaria hyperparasitica]KAF2756565.1 hypothetical protein EJ05DRAFT_502068 [Pseudovirgaria hyperparasitica]